MQGICPPGWQNQGGYPPEIAELTIFLTGIKFCIWKMGLFEKIVHQIQGVFNVEGSFGVSKCKT